MSIKTKIYKKIIADLMPDDYSLENEFDFIKALHLYAENLNILLTKELCLETALNDINQDPFVYWLNHNNHNSESNFSAAKKKMVEKKLIPQPGFQPATIEEFRCKYRLEYMCSAIIRFLLDHEDKLKQIPARKGDHNLIRKRMIYIRDELQRLGTIPFENEVWQTLFQMSLDKLLATDDRNVHSTGGWHEKIVSELMCKKMMAIMCLAYWEHELSADFIITIALQVTAHFFLTTMDMKEAKKHFPKIKADMEKTIQLRNKTVGTLLTEYALEQQIYY